MNAADGFCDLLRARLTQAQHEPSDLPILGPEYRCDGLFLEAADFSDSLSLYEQGEVGESVIRAGALSVAALACRIYWATVTGVTGANDGD